MGKKRIAAKGETGGAPAMRNAAASQKKRTVERAVVYVESTYNNTRLTLTDERGNALASASSGSLGFHGAKKGTPFAAAKVGEALAARAQAFGVREVCIIVKGVGSGRESSIRSFTNKGFALSSIRDATPVPHNGPRPPGRRRV